MDVLGLFQAERGLALLTDYDHRIKALLTEIFGGENDFDKVLEGVNLPADNHKVFLESMAPTFKPDGMPSMRQDVLAKRPTEVEQFAGVVRRLAQKHGMPTPANDFFYEKIREIEANYNK